MSASESDPPAVVSDRKVDNQRIRSRQLVALISGPLVMIALVSVPAPGALTPEAWKLVALTSWMVIWWMTEAAPVPVTALLPVPMMPMLDIAPQTTVASSYGDPLIFLFLGGFLIATAMQRWNLHRRIALNIVARVGAGPASIVAGFMLATASLSMWISNTATTVMMLAVGISMIGFVSEHGADPDKTRRFGVALMLGIAYSASIGGVGTLIGTPPNTLMASYLAKNHGIIIDFATWMKMGIPIVLVFLPITWLLLCKLIYPLSDLGLGNAGAMIRAELQSLGRRRRGETIVLAVFCLTALAWILRQPLVSLTGLTITDTSIALLAATLLFVLPASIEQGQFTVDWSAAKSIPWGVLILFGGGLALAGAFSSTGLAAAIGNAVGGLGYLNLSLIILVTIACIIFLTEITSNTATTATFLPILGAVAVGLGHEATTLAVPVALSASMAFMMPVATPPNAIVFSYEGLRISDMMRAGIWLNLIAIALIYIAVRWLGPWVFGAH